VADSQFGDFQTPLELARRVCARAEALFGTPGTVIEPTCGVGAFLVAAHEHFGERTQLHGVELNAEYVARARATLDGAGATVNQGDFFELDWSALTAQYPGPLLVIGNPPWVTNSAQGATGGVNLPAKSNAQQRAGIEAITGVSNFDISEWMGLRLLEVLAGRDASLAILIKVAVARKLLHHAWTRGLPIRDAAIFPVDARKHFGAAVDACLFVARTDVMGPQRCPVYRGLDDETPTGAVGVDDDGVLVADIDARQRSAALAGAHGHQWRSGIKHDCTRVLQLQQVGRRLENGFGQAVDVELKRRFPLMKGSDVANGRTDTGRQLIVPQKSPGEDTADLELVAPKTWAYLNEHAALLASRRSSIYRKRPPFSIFGVGPYTFTPWKVAICGLYKKLKFVVVGPRGGRPVVFDDTVYLSPCDSEEEAREKAALLNSEAVRDFYSSFIFWDEKRPITAAILRRL